jgi:deazaflavin-dependent oxidoreductase (nitroreductase family)
MNLQMFAEDDFCYLTTTGRVTGRPHTIEIWFGQADSAIYLLAGGGHDADWVKNLQRSSDVSVRFRDQTFAGTARVVTQAEEDALARRLVVGKYQPRDSDDLSEWGRTALAVAIDILGT